MSDAPRDPSDLPDLLDPDSRPWPLPLRVLAGVVGSLFLMVGFLGIIIPILPGVPFLLVAAFLLGGSSPDLRRAINDFERRCPPWLRRSLRWRRRAAPTPVPADDELRDPRDRDAR